MARIGFLPDDIDVVLNTHLHADHCGGNTKRNGQDVVAAFPNAEYWMQRQEFLDASFPNERTRQRTFPTILSLSNAVCLMNGDMQMTEEVRTMITPGHTRAHQSIILESKGEKAFFWRRQGEPSIWNNSLGAFLLYRSAGKHRNKRRVREWAYEENVLLIFYMTR